MSSREILIQFELFNHKYAKFMLDNKTDRREKEMKKDDLSFGL